MLIPYTMLPVALFVFRNPNPPEKFVGLFFFNPVKICEMISHMPISFYSE